MVLLVVGDFSNCSYLLLEFVIKWVLFSLVGYLAVVLPVISIVPSLIVGE